MARRHSVSRRSPLIAGFAGLLFAASLHAQPAQTTGPLTLEAAFARALSANPTIAAARLRRDVNLLGVAVARERLNPEARVELEKETPTQSFSLAVPLELGRRRSRRIALSEATVRAGDAELVHTIIEIRSQVRRTYFTRRIAEARLAVWGELQVFAARLRDAAQQRFDAGSAPRLEVLQAQLTLAQAENEATVAAAAAQSSTVQLNALLGLSLDAVVALADPVDLGGATLGVQAALTQAQAANAELAVLDRRIDEQRARLALAQALRTPDVTTEGTLTRNAEPEFMTGWRAAVAVTLPVFTTHRTGVRVEAAALAQLQAERQATLALITGEVTSAAALTEAQRLAYLRYRDQILPQALDVERMAEDSYRLGQTGIAALLQALQASRDVRLQSLQTASDFQGALAELERVVGAPIP